MVKSNKNKHKKPSTTPDVKTAKTADDLKKMEADPALGGFIKKMLEGGKSKSEEKTTKQAETDEAADEAADEAKAKAVEDGADEADDNVADSTDDADSADDADDKDSADSADVAEKGRRAKNDIRDINARLALLESSLGELANLLKQQTHPAQQEVYPAPVQSAPAQSVPVQSAPTQSVPTQSVPAQSVPAQGIPVQGVLAQGGLQTAYDIVTAAADERVKHLVITRYLAELNKGGVKLIGARDGGGYAVTPPRSPRTIGDAGELAREYLK